MANLIFAVDDESAIRNLYNCAFNGSDFNIKTFENADTFFKGLETELPDLVILDVMLDGIDGFEILTKLKENAKYNAIPVIMVSAKGEELDKVNGLNLGANDYLSKPFGVLELIARVKANLRKTAKQQKLTYKDVTVDDGTHVITVAGQRVEFTLKEYNLLKLLMENSGKVVSREEIFNKVWGENFITETRTLDIHVNEIRRKIENSQVVVNTVRGVGYLLV